MATRVMSVEEIVRRYAKRSLMSFLEGGRYTKNHRPLSLSWIVGILESSGIRGRDLMEVFRELGGYDDPIKFAEVFAACQRRGWMSDQEEG